MNIKTEHLIFHQVSSARKLKAHVLFKKSALSFVHPMKCTSFARNAIQLNNLNIEPFASTIIANKLQHIHIHLYTGDIPQEYAALYIESQPAAKLRRIT